MRMLAPSVDVNAKLPEGHFASVTASSSARPAKRLPQEARPLGQGGHCRFPKIWTLIRTTRRGAPPVDRRGGSRYPPRSNECPGCAMKVRSSLKSLKARHKDCRLVRRKGRVYVINKTQRRYKARQG